MIDINELKVGDICETRGGCLREVLFFDLKVPEDMDGAIVCRDVDTPSLIYPYFRDGTWARLGDNNADLMRVVPKEPKPIAIWLNVFDDGGVLKQSLCHKSKAAADASASLHTQPYKRVSRMKVFLKSGVWDE